jgi:hypothetical protein
MLRQGGNFYFDMPGISKAAKAAVKKQLNVYMIDNIYFLGNGTVSIKNYL